jgi:hypothetical protein
MTLVWHFKTLNTARPHIFTARLSCIGMGFSISQIWLVVLVVLGRSVLLECFTAQSSILRRNPSLPSLYLIPPDQCIATAFVPRIYSREDAQSIIDETLMPKQEYSERIGWGRDAQGLNELSGPLKATDPRLSMTYAEFPLTSMDELIDLGLQSLPPDKQKAQKISLVDLGSGCGRLVIYSAMTRGSTENGQSWDVQGIEIADLLHGKGLDYMNEGMHAGILSSEDSSKRGIANTLSLNLGSAEKYASVLRNADIVFAYSTAFPAKQFSPELSALILDPEWSVLLSKSCSSGCVAITTDRALDPNCGWELVDRMDVENPEVFGTTGYIHVLRG